MRLPNPSMSEGGSARLMARRAIVTSLLVFRCWRRTLGVLAASGAIATLGTSFSSGVAAAAATPVGYTKVEQRAWERYLQGEEIRLPGECPDEQKGSGQHANGIEPADYTLSGTFVADILRRSPPGLLTGPPPVIIHGARIKGDLVVDGDLTPGPVKISCTTVDGDVRFQDWQAFQGLELWKVRINGSLKLLDVRAQSLVAIAESEIESIEVIRSRFSRDLSLRGTRVHKHLKIASTVVDGSLLMGCRANQGKQCCCGEYNRTILLGVKVTNTLDLIGSRFRDEVHLQDIRVGASVQASHTGSSKGVSVLNSTVGGGFYMAHSNVYGPLSLSALSIRGGVALHDSYIPHLTIHRSDIERDIEFQGSTLRLLSLEGTSAHGEIRMGTENSPMKWVDNGENAKFVARNTRAKSLLDTDDTWPRGLRLELDGFEYDRLSGVTEAGRSAYLRGADWFKEWLAGDETYSPQPYRHLYEILVREGQREVANEIAYAAKELERRSLPPWSAARVWLEIMRWSIGYGIGLKPLWVLVWISVLAILSWLVAVVVSRGRGVGVLPLFWFSIAHTFPGLTEVNDDERTARLPLAIRRWFAFQRLLCVALASLAGAAAVGLVQP